MAPTVAGPRGMRDFLPAVKARREHVIGVIRDQFSVFGYTEIETPVAEELDRLQSGQGGDNEKLIFKIMRRGLAADVALLPAEAADLGLRYDLTVPLTRFYATHRARLPQVFRSIQIAPVWRAERPQKGRYRQFTQCDIDVIGEGSMIAEVELIAATCATLDRLGITGSVIRLNDRRLLAAILDNCGFPAEAHGAALVIVDKLDKIGVVGVADELARAAGGTNHATKRLVALLEGLVAAMGEGGPGSFDATLEVASGGATEVVRHLSGLRDALRRAAPSAEVVADPTVVRGMGYYTGTIFELGHPSSISSIGGGGRYDGMVGRLTGNEVPGCGISLGFERIIDLVEESSLGAGRRRVALIYDDQADPGALVAAQQSLIEQGSTVRLVRRTRNLAHLLDGLTEEGFHSSVTFDSSVALDSSVMLDSSVSPDSGPSPLGELRPIRKGLPGASGDAGDAQ